MLGSPQFQAIWTATLTSVHQLLVAVLRGQHTAAVSTSGGYIVLNTVPLINQALGKVSGLASDLTGKPVTLPAITSADPPQQAVNKLSKALEVTLPSDFGQITRVKSSDLATVQRGGRPSTQSPWPALGHDRPDRPEPVAVGQSPQNRAPAGGGRSC